MKYNILGLGTLLVGAVMLGSCSLDETPKSKFDEKDAFANSTLIYVNSVANVYSAIGNSIYGDAGAAVHTLQEFTSDATMLPGRQGDWWKVAELLPPQLRILCGYLQQRLVKSL